MAGGHREGLQTEDKCLSTFICKETDDYSTWPIQILTISLFSSLTSCQMRQLDDVLRFHTPNAVDGAQAPAGSKPKRLDGKESTDALPESLLFWLGPDYNVSSQSQTYCSACLLNAICCGLSLFRYKQ